MSAAIKKANTANITVDKKMRGYSNDPTVKKRAEEAREFLKKNPLPKWLFEKKK